MKYDITIIGGLGHVGLPLGLSFAREGLQVCLYDLDQRKADLVSQGIMPFVEYGAAAILPEVLARGKIAVSLDINDISNAGFVIVAVPTPCDSTQIMQPEAFLKLFSTWKKYIQNHQTIIIRSTVFPGTCRQIAPRLEESFRSWHIAYCPERTMQGYSMKELKELPQIVAGISPQAQENASRLFGLLSPKIIPTTIEEAELVKLFTNALRYLQFAAANQFFMIAEQCSVEFSRIREVMMDSYGRLGSLPTAGFAAGPCLLKDSLQLLNFCPQLFSLGRAAVLINEGLPEFIVGNLKKKYDLNLKTIGILGMTFKADIDDTRDSLSLKLASILRLNGAKVLCSDEFLNDKSFVSKEALIAQVDIVIVGVPHSSYRELMIPEHVELVDLWGVCPKGSLTIQPFSKIL